MTKLCCDVLAALKGKTLSTAESCTGGGIGAALTAIPGSSSVYKGGVISYCNEIKHRILGVDEAVLSSKGAVSAEVAQAMAIGAKTLLQTDVAVSVTGLAGPTGDEFGHPVGTVYIGYEDQQQSIVQHYVFDGNRDAIRNQTIDAALDLILQHNP